MSGSTRTVNDLRAFLQTRKGFNSQQTTEFFDTWAETYDQDMKMLNYREPNLLVNLLDANFSGNRSEARVLDVACGSGLVAKLMFELGFRHFVGVDSSKRMLEQAAKTGLYEELKEALLGTEALPAETGAFDVVIIVGALRECSVPVSVIRELCQAAKPGGYVCMTRIEPKSEAGNKYKMSLEKEHQLMVTEKLWTCVDAKEIDKYVIDAYTENKNEQNKQYLGGSMYIYRKSIN
ncbi:methyltransferase-like protein 27 [Plectropomus leopardus]|uniref:methyltransferase-like protein 27 n=1 Tax=Plectropomus leopardus TaxID=160734 RepID=UPI001C4AF8C8|nr:methyltransferase-like protein 27 [Plectropomus leopardus]XP_042346312.1 methyltransferase-like protein 27 [Plectropomus leopardus]